MSQKGETNQKKSSNRSKKQSNSKRNTENINESRLEISSYHQETPNSIPDQLKVIIPQEIWDSYSPIRQESFKLILSNPNSFFYRNRPPGEFQIKGGFTDEERELFFKRVYFFREVLKMKEIRVWGLFAVPLTGRVGYQCSSFYRQCIKEGSIIDDSYSILPDGKLVYKRIGNPPEYDPIRAKTLLEEEAMRHICRIIDEKKDGELIVHSSERSLAPKRILNTNYPDEIYYHAAKAMVENDLTEEESEYERPIIFPEDVQTPVHFALDPISNKPILIPMLDINSGIVMDKKSWINVFDGKASSPYITYAPDIYSLIEITDENFGEFEEFINNIPY